MTILPPPIRALAQKVLAAEGAVAGSSDILASPQARIAEKLRGALIQLLGPDGFTALLKRALGLAKTELPWLDSIQVNNEGHLQGMEAFGGDEEKAGRAGLEITVQLLGLLVTFIGESLTLRLVRNTWPDVPVDD